MNTDSDNIKPDFEKSVKKARELLLLQDEPKNFRTDVKRLRFPPPLKIEIKSFEYICTVTGISVKELSHGGKLWDGYAVVADGRDGVPDTVMILYGDGSYEDFLHRQSGYPARHNFEKCRKFSGYSDFAKPRHVQTSGTARKSWTIAHEIGHILLEHVDDGQTSEIEANFFAAELLMPQEVLSALSVKVWGGTFPVSEIVRYFAVSQTAALRRAKSLSYSTSAGFADCGGLILQKYSHLIDN